ncbi:putative lipoprotein LpqN [Mycobacteroides abscessus subsp. abscessus]|nr:putative lipoprotein LpqN [Mycobacteroides abscessus subsp. abscessus]
MSGPIIRCVAAVSAAVLLGACGGKTDEKPTTATKSDGTTTTATSTSAPSSTTASGSKMPDLPTYGVVETTKRPVAAGEQVCDPPSPPAQTMTVTTGAPGSPTVVVAVPDGFSQGAPASGDVALNLTGPDGLTGTVKITPTPQDAAAAFQGYADARTAGHEFNSVSILPDELCGYSGQKLMGVLADKPGSGSDYVDRIVHVWTDSGNYLIALQLQGPAGSKGLDAAKPVLLGDFGIRMS